MQDDLPLPIVCTMNSRLALEFAHLKALLMHPFLQEDEKLLWLWLATCAANNSHLSFSINYEQLSSALNKPAKRIHRMLFRLRVSGFLLGNIPIWYGELTPEMVHEVRSLQLVLPINRDDETTRELALLFHSRQRKALNLSKEKNYCL